MTLRPFCSRAGYRPKKRGLLLEGDQALQHHVEMVRIACSTWRARRLAIAVKFASCSTRVHSMRDLKDAKALLRDLA